MKPIDQAVSTPLEAVTHAENLRRADRPDVPLVTHPVEVEHYFRHIPAAEPHVQRPVATSDGAAAVVPASFLVLDGRSEDAFFPRRDPRFGRWVCDEAWHDTHDTGGALWLR